MQDFYLKSAFCSTGVELCQKRLMAVNTLALLVRMVSSGST